MLQENICIEELEKYNHAGSAMLSAMTSLAALFALL